MEVVSLPAGEVVLLLLFVAALVFIFILAAAANLIVLVVFARRPALRTLSNRFVINLLVSNLLACSLLFPMALLDGLAGWGATLPPHVCGAAEGTVAMVAAASILATLLIAVDQYLGVTDPLHYHMRVTKPLCVVLMAGQWGVAVLVSILAALHPQGSSFRGLCAHQSDDPPGIFRIGFVLLFGTAVFLVPLVMLAAIHSRIYLAAQRNSRRTRSSPGSPTLPASSSQVTQSSSSRPSSFRSLRSRISNASLFRYREEGRAARVSILVLGATLLCWLPYFCTAGLHALRPHHDLHIPRAMDTLALFLTLTHSLISPMLYAYRSRRLRREVRRLFGLVLTRPRPLCRPVLQHTVTPATPAQRDRKMFMLALWVGQGPKSQLALPEPALATETRSSFSSATTQGTSSTDTADL